MNSVSTTMMVSHWLAKQLSAEASTLPTPQRQTLTSEAAVPAAAELPLKATDTPASSSSAADKVDLLPEVNGCGCLFDVAAAERSGSLRKDDPIQEHYKKTGGGMWG